MRRILMVVWGIVVSLSVIAQENYKQGYIIKNEGDTVSGWIDYRTTRINNLQCKFRLSENSEVITYHPGEIRGYRFTGEGKYYISKEIALEDNSPQTIFLEYLISGILDVYHYEDDKAVYYLFEDDKGEITTVSKQHDDGRVVYKDGKYIRQEDLKYVGMLNYIFKDSPTVMKKVNKYSIREENIIKLTKEYHQNICTTGEDCILYVGQPGKKYYKLSLNIFAGAKNNKYYYTDEHEKQKSSNFLSPLFGVGFDLTMPRWNENVACFFEFSVSKLKENKISLDSWLFDGRIGGRYTFNRKARVQPSLGGSFTVFTENEYGDVVTGFSGELGVNIATYKRQYVFIRADYMLLRLTGDDDFSGIRFRMGYSF